MSGTVAGRRTIRLIDLKGGWIFNLHVDAGRVWLVSSPTETPVATSFIFAHASAAFERAVVRCADHLDMCAVACRFAPAHIRAQLIAGPVADAA
jgi:hypothetical protein